MTLRGTAGWWATGTSFQRPAERGLRAEDPSSSYSQEHIFCFTSLHDMGHLLGEKKQGEGQLSGRQLTT